MSYGVQTKVQAGPAQSFTSAGMGLLQRKCTLCNTPRLVEDSERDEESLILQRSPVDQAEPYTVAPIVHEVLRSPGQPLAPQTGAFMEMLFGHDFSWVSNLSDAPLIQAKLTISQPNDRYDQEADRVTDEVMRIPESQAVSSDTLSIHRTCPTCEEEELRRQSIKEEEEEELLQTKEISEQNAETTSDLESRINAIRGGGHPLTESERSFFEPRFGYDFSQVRVHTDTQAAESARVLNARAFTVGRDVFFGKEQYAPGTSAGNRLIGHELTHVVQQIIIPARIRNKYGLKKGEKLLIVDENDYIKIVPETRLADLVGSVKLDINIVKKQIEEMRKEDRY